MMRAALIATMVALPAPASELNCMPYADMSAWLMNDFEETPGAIGTHEDIMWMFWVNEGTGTWSVIALTGETACLIASGADGAKVFPMGVRS